MNILVGANNCGKSTIIGAFRLLAAALKRARGRSPQYLIGPDGSRFYGYSLAEENLPVSVENVHTDYADTDTQVVFRLSNSNLLRLYFPRRGGISLLLDTAGKDARTATAFRTAFPVSIATVPVLGPVEHEEDLVQLETVQRGLDTHRASRHFRSYWIYNRDDFEPFAELVERTWPGMQIEKPERDLGSTKLNMFCLENRITREIYWSGFGFQVWCQLLTHVSRASTDTMLVVDEPEIYLHPDIQRQMLAILRQAGPPVLLATHSSEIIGEADPAEILLIDKSARSGERLRDVEGVQIALNKVGSLHNLTLTRLARNRRVLFVEGENDFTILRRFAQRAGLSELSAGVDITPTQSGGFSRWSTVKDFSWGVTRVLKTRLAVAAIFDRDYWCSEELRMIEDELHKSVPIVHFHSRKEIENYLLDPAPLTRAIRDALGEQPGSSSDRPAPTEAEVREIITRLTEPFRALVLSQLLARKTEYLRKTGSKMDAATISQAMIAEFEAKWSLLEGRIQIVPGKDVIRSIREELQEKFGISLTTFRIIDSFHRNDIPSDLMQLLSGLEQFRVS